MNITDHHRCLLKKWLWKILNNKHLNQWLPVILILTIFTSSFLLNFSILNSNTAPPGADYGNYLMQVDILRGNDLRGIGLRHQPLFFFILDGFMRMFDAFTALKVASALVFSIITVPFFFLAKKLSGNTIAAAISTGLFVFFISAAEMISWGGNPNFLGFSFMLLAIYFLIDLINNPSKRSVILSGLSISLVIGTHVLVAIFLFFSLFVFALFNLAFIQKRKEKIKNNLPLFFYLLLAASVFSLPYVSFYLSFMQHSASQMVGFWFLGFDFAAPIDIGIETWHFVADFFVIGAFSGLGLFCISNYLKENRANGLLLFSIILSPLILFLFTVQPLRWVYFLPIPFLLGFSIFLKNLFYDVKRVKKITISLFTALFIITMLIQSPYIATSHFLESSDFYQFIEKNEIKALEWVKTNTSPDATFATSGHPKDVGGGGNSYAWWIEGYAQRKCLFTGFPEYFSYQYEIDEIKVANRIFSGTYSLDYGALRITESYPANNVNPQIEAIIDDKYEELFVLNDCQHQLFYYSHDEQIYSGMNFYSDSKTSNIDYTENYANISVNYDHYLFDLNRSVIVEETSSVDIIYQISPKNSSLEMLKLNLWGLFITSENNANTDSEGVVTFSEIVSKNTDAEIRVIETNGNFLGARVVFEDFESSKPIINYLFEPSQDDLYVRLRITVNTSNQKIEQQTLDFYKSQDLLKELSIDYIFINKYRHNEHQRFLEDTDNFSIVHGNNDIEIFKVIKPIT